MIYSADYSKGFGGKFGVQKDRVDKVNIVGFDKQYIKRAKCFIER